MRRQQLIFVEHWDTNRGHLPNRAQPIPYDGPKPARIWTLLDAAPTLPITPAHNVNAFLEDYIHDWNLGPGKFLRYYSRVADRPVWILLEFDDKKGKAR